jgi:hypothetical protein
MAPSSDLLQGTLDLLILQTLALEPMHGWGVAQRIQQVSKEVLKIGQGSLYPAPYRLEYKGWIRPDDHGDLRRASYKEEYRSCASSCLLFRPSELPKTSSRIIRSVASFKYSCNAFSI